MRINMRRKYKISTYNLICLSVIIVCFIYVIGWVGYRYKMFDRLSGLAGENIAKIKEQIIKNDTDDNMDNAMPVVEIEKNNESVMVVINNENAMALDTGADIFEGAENGLSSFDTMGGKLTKSQIQKLNKNRNLIKVLRDEKKPEFLINNFFSVDATTSVTEEMMNPKKLLSFNVALKDVEKKDAIILIYHTHSSETYSDSVKGKRSDTIVGVGDYLTKLLEEKGYTVIHDSTAFDIKDGKWNRESYDTALPKLKKHIKDNPGIVVTIDLHRNSGRQKAVTTMNGKNVAQIMLFNGVSRNKTGQRLSLVNDNLQGNLAFSLRLLMCSMEKYPDFARKTYIKGYRYNLHLVPRALLVEVGNEKNSVAEAKAAMVPFSEMLDEVLTGKYK